MTGLDWAQGGVVVVAAPFLLFPTVSPWATGGICLLIAAVLVLRWRLEGAAPVTPLNGALTVWLAMIAVGAGVSAFPEHTLPKLTGLLLGALTWLTFVRAGRNQGGRQRRGDDPGEAHAGERSPRLQLWLRWAFVLVGLGAAGLGILTTDWPSKIPGLAALIARLPPTLVALPSAPEIGVHANELGGTVVPYLAVALSLLLGALAGTMGRAQTAQPRTSTDPLPPAAMAGRVDAAGRAPSPSKAPTPSRGCLVQSPRRVSGTDGSASDETFGVSASSGRLHDSKTPKVFPRSAGPLPKISRGSALGRPGPGRRIWTLVALGLITAGIAALLVLTQSRSAWIGALVSGGVVVALWARLLPAGELKSVLRIGLGLALVAAVGAGLRLGPEGLRRLWEEPAQLEAVGGVNTLSFRFEVWRWALMGVQDFFFTGCGLGAFREVGRLLYPMAIAPSYDYAHAHNIFLQVALDTGVPGLVAYLALLGIAIRQAWRTAREDPAQRAWALGLLGGLVALHVFGLTDAIAPGAKPGLVFWMMVGLTTQESSG